jgi:hypothetical protein
MAVNIKWVLISLLALCVGDSRQQRWRGNKLMSAGNPRHSGLSRTWVFLLIEPIYDVLISASNSSTIKELQRKVYTCCYCCIQFSELFSWKETCEVVFLYTQSDVRMKLLHLTVSDVNRYVIIANLLDSVYISMALQSFVGPSPLFQFLNPIRSR